MKFKIKNLGPIRQAEFELGNLTTISGLNNTGKTYVTHAMFGFLDYFEQHHDIAISKTDFSDLLRHGKLEIDLAIIHDDRERLLTKAAADYSKVIGEIFASTEALFSSTELTVTDVAKNPKLLSRVFSTKLGTKSGPMIQLEKLEGSTKLIASLLIEDQNELAPPVEFARHFISRAIKDIVFEEIAPRPFISSAERTGAAIFQKELDFTRNRLIEILGDKTNTLSPFDLLSPFKGNYPVAVRKNVDFIRALGTLKKRTSFIFRDHPHLLDKFRDILGGDYVIDKEGDVQFVPVGTKTKLALVESSSSVRSLLDLGFYLRHLAQHGDLLVIDEPELNLHPENQRKLARLFACLVNIGIKVFITTHSDYIIKELSTLLMFHQEKAHLDAIAQTEGYTRDEFLDCSSVRSYMAIKEKILLDGNTRKSDVLTLVSAEISQERGIELRSFDETIETMNRIQDAIVWGGNGAQ